MGSGTIETMRKLKVNIPPGVDNDHQVRFKEKGNEGSRRSGKAGDLYLSVKVENDTQFTRQENNIHINIPLTISQAILGDTIKVPTCSTEVLVKVPPGIQHASVHKLKGKGVRGVGSKNAGDQYIHWQVQIPTNLAPEQLDIIRQFGEEECIIEPRKSVIKTNVDKIMKYFTRN